jgi:hypothetical protein
MTIQDLETAVTQLRPNELKKFRVWFEEFDAVRWDKQFEADIQTGKLDALAQQALDDFSAGKCTEI